MTLRSPLKSWRHTPSISVVRKWRQKAIKFGFCKFFIHSREHYPRAAAPSTQCCSTATSVQTATPCAPQKPQRPRSESRPHRVGVNWYRTDSVGKLASDLGPPRSARHRKSGDFLSVRTVDADFIGHRSPNGVAWRFPDWTAVGFRFPEPDFLGSAALCLPLPESSCGLGSTLR